MVFLFRSNQSESNLARGNRSQGQSATSSTYSMSLGIAAILQGREDSLGSRSLMRPVASCPVIPADSIAMPGAKSGTATSTSRPRPSATVAVSPSSPALATDSSSTEPGAGLFGKLISTGYSLLWNKDTPNASGANTPRQGTPEKVSKEQILQKGGPGGVLGAIASFRKNGVL